MIGAGLVVGLGAAMGIGALDTRSGSSERVIEQFLASDPVLASHLARVAVLDLGLRETPTPTDYLLAATVLSIASDLDPDNADLARSVVEASYSAGNRAMMMIATRRVIKIDPRDTVAQLRLVSSVINHQQTVEGRLKLYDRFLGDAGKAFDPSVRSRLALDAALLERERGNSDGFIERLRLATTLDVSHKAAASLWAQFYGQSTQDTVTLLNHQFRLLFADPLDPNVHMTITRILASEGAYGAARRFLNNAINLYKLDAGRTPAQIEEIRYALDWQIDGPKKILDELNPILTDRRAEAQMRIDSYIEAQLPIDELPVPEDIRYPLGLDKIRLLASYNLDDQEATQKVLDDINHSVNGDVSKIGELMAQRGVDQDVLRKQVVTIFTDFQVMRAIVGLEGDQIREDIKEIVDSVPAMEPYFASIEPMALYAEGNYQQALDLAKEFSKSRVLDLLIGLCNEKLGKTQEAIDLYAMLTRGYALDSYGAFARSRMMALGAGDQTLSLAGRQMGEIADTIPDWLDQMITRPSTFMYLDMIAPEGSIDAIENPMITIRLKNLAPIPMAVGPSQPMDSRFLIVPRIDIGAGFEGLTSSKVVELNHRLRLGPLEEMSATVPADSVTTQWLLKMQSSVTIRQRWRLLQGFRPRTPDSVLSQIEVDSDASIFGIVNSPLGLTDESDVVRRMVLDETNSDVDHLIAQLSSDVEDTRRRAVIAGAGRLLLPAPGRELMFEEKEALVGALIELYTLAKNDERARMILVLPHRHQVPEMMAFDDHVVGSLLSDALIDSQVDPVVLVGALLTRTDAADSPIFEVLDQVSDPRINVIAGIIRARIESSTPTIGMIGPGVDSMLPNKQFLGP